MLNIESTSIKENNGWKAVPKQKHRVLRMMLSALSVVVTAAAIAAAASFFI